MKTKQKARLAMAVGLPLFALAALISTETPVSAFANCLYAGETYSSGACIASVCEKPEGQMCNDGVWTPCAGCVAG